MTPGGVTEIITHFIGYWHITEEIARARLLYDSNHHDVVLEYAPLPFRDVRPPPELDELTSAGPRYTLIDGLPRFAVDPIPGANPLSPPARHAGEIPTGSRMQLPPSGVGSGSTALGPAAWRPGDDPDPVIRVTYDIGGDQRLFHASQIKMLVDSDLLYLVAGTGVENLQTLDLPATLRTMLDEAKAHLPAEFELLTGGNAQAVVDFIKAQSVALAAGVGEQSADEAGQGTVQEVVANQVYVNGAPLPEGEERPTAPSLERHEFDLPRTDGTVAGVSAELGSNTSYSAAGIVDANEETMTLVVLGNVFQTDAIIQTNVLKDHDHVEIVGPERGGTMTPAGNIANNIAEFIQNDLFATLKPGAIFAGFEWRVDIFEGDFLDIKTLVQENWIIDNDVTVQTTSGAYDRVLAGGSLQLGLADIVDLGKYELIIIGQNYYTSNFILQTNILLDDDILKIAASLGEDDAARSSQSVSWEGNTLTNDAVIERIGSSSFGTIDEQLMNLIEAIRNGDTELASSYGRLLNGDGTGTFDILYVTGNYYDINIVSQTNVMVDADTAVQLLPDILAPRGETLEQTASTGGNVQTNTAAIMDVSALSDQYLGGEFYHDAMLVQANIVVGADEEDRIVAPDPDELISEVIAFIDPQPAGSEEAPLARPTVHADDVMGSMLT